MGSKKLTVVSDIDKGYLELAITIVERRSKWYRREYYDFLKDVHQFIVGGAKDGLKTSKPDYTTREVTSAERALRGSISWLNDEQISSLQSMVEKKYPGTNFLKMRVIALYEKEKDKQKVADAYGIPITIVKRWIRESGKT